MAQRLLIVEDDEALLEMLSLHFEDAGFDVQGATSWRAASARLQAARCDLVLLDQQLPDGRGSELLGEILAQDPDLPVIMITGQHDLELAIGQQGDCAQRPQLGERSDHR